MKAIRNSRRRGADSKEDGCAETPSSGAPDEGLVDTIVKACRSIKDARYVVVHSPEGRDVNEMIEQAKARARNRSHAEIVCDKLIANKSYWIEKQCKYEDAEVRWRRAVCEYEERCALESVMSSNAVKLKMFLDMVWPHYQGVTVDTHGDIAWQMERNKVKEYCIECMLRMWDKLASLEIAKEEDVSFRRCAVSMLNALCEGVETDVCVPKKSPNNNNDNGTENDQKPYRLSSLTSEELAEVEIHRVVFVSKHRGLVLIPNHNAQADQLMLSTTNTPTNTNNAKKSRGTTATISRRLKGTRRGRRGNSKKRNWMSGRMGSGCGRRGRQGKTRQRATKSSSSKLLNKMLDNAITECRTFTELQSFCLANMINPRFQ
jgi:hypothetical protein